MRSPRCVNTRGSISSPCRSGERVSAYAVVGTWHWPRTPGGCPDAVARFVGVAVFGLPLISSRRWHALCAAPVRGRADVRHRQCASGRSPRRHGSRSLATSRRRWIPRSRTRPGARVWRPSLCALQASPPVFGLSCPEPLLEKPAPTRRQRQREHGLEPVRPGLAVADQGQHAGDAVGRVWPVDEFARIAGLDPTRLQHAQIPPRTPAGLDACGHVRNAKAQVELEAGLPTLRDRQQRAADTPTIPDADDVLVEPVDAQVLAERAGRIQQGLIGKDVAPGFVMGPGVAEHGLVGAAVHAEIGLLVPGEPQVLDSSRPAHRPLGDTADGRAERLHAADEHGSNARRHRFKPIGCARTSRTARDRAPARARAAARGPGRAARRGRCRLASTRRCGRSAIVRCAWDPPRGGTGSPARDRPP